jgi:hypothetical protein
MRSCENKLQSFKNSFIVDLLPIYFLTRSKKASSSDEAAEVEVGGRGSGRTGVKVGETAGTSGAFCLLCVNLFRCERWLAMMLSMAKSGELVNVK